MRSMIENVIKNHLNSPTAYFSKSKQLYSYNQLWRYCLILFSLLFISGILVISCGNEQAEGTTTGGRNSANRDSQISAAIPVKATAVRRGDISKFLMQTTTIEAESQVDILAKVAGQVVKLPAEEGMRVKKGNLLAQLNEAELQIAYIQAKVSMETDMSMLERAKNMLENNLIAAENYETIRLQYESSKAVFESASLQLEHTYIRAPFDGVVTVRNIELGQRVNVNQSLFSVADFDPLRAKIYVPEKDMGKIFEGQAAKIMIESEPDLEFKGIVKMVSPVVDPNSGTAKVTLDVTDDRGKLKPGMFASVFITTETHENTLLIPKKALIIETDTDQVYIFQNGKSHKVTLELGFTSGENVEILAGLKEGDLVVTAGQDGLREGLPIRIPELELAMADQVDSNTIPSGSTVDQSNQIGNSGTNSDQNRGSIEKFSSDNSPDIQQLQRMENRLMQNPEIKKEYENRLKTDPDLKSNLKKKWAFFQEMSKKIKE